MSAARVIIQDRDRQIFRFVGEHETATFEQIKAKFWPSSANDETAKQRLDKLRRAGYIARHDYQPDVLHATSRYTITKKVLRETASENASRMYTGKLIEREITQAIKSVEARLELERRGYTVEGWISERQLQREQQAQIAQARKNGHHHPTAPAISDGQAVILNPDGKVVCADVEIDGQYWGRMLTKKINGFAGRHVFWACTPERAERVQQAAGDNIKVVTV